jgi:nitroimidazol reductase NimA-like FMN-containing flavoprotein (pyridoxamine 5'-phosphate oxidase superfamily)
MLRSAAPVRRSCRGRRCLPGRAYNARDGFSRVVPIGYHWSDDDQIVMCAAPSALKVAALEARPELAITIDTEEVPSRARLERWLAATKVRVSDEYVAASTKAMDETRLEEFQATVRGVLTGWAPPRSQGVGFGITTSAPVGCQPP